jgi:diguanylate cyclase (GGDEF)-like protein/PAS domain S-box-containing protein
MKWPLTPELLIDRHITPTFALDREGAVATWNKACEILTGLKAADVLGTRDHWRGFFAEPRPCLADLLLSDRIEAVAEHYDLIADVRGRRDAIAAEDWFVMPSDGRRLYIAIEAVVIRDEDGEIIAAIETLRDLTAMKATETRFRSLAGLDGLTGIANRRTFEDALATEWRRAVRSGTSLSLLMVDIDHFKQFNDQLGHQRGDACLRDVAVALANATRRAGDFPARYGGEEFGVLLPATDAAGAAHIAENIRAAVERLAAPHPLSSAGPVVTVSIGAASVAPTVADRVEKLVCFADIALYRAKDSGRNRTCSFTDAPGCALAKDQPTARVEIPIIGSDSCASCRKDAPTARSQ